MVETKAAQLFVDEHGACFRTEDRRAVIGGQADVWFAQGQNGQLVVVKWFRDEVAAARELDEARRVRTADAHADEWVSLPLSGGRREGRSFLVFLRADQDLRAALTEADLPEKVGLVLAAARALRRYHQSAVGVEGYRVHRDVKPANFLRCSGRVLLADLGGARSARTQESQVNTAIWSPHFAPAEQRLPTTGGPSESWDVYGMAATVVYGLTGQPPLAAMEADGLLTRDAQELVRLSHRAQVGELGQSEKRRYIELQARKVEDFLQLGGARGWYPGDGAALRSALDGWIDADHPLLGRLEQALDRALEPDPRRRSGDLRELLGALRGLAEHIGVAEPQAPSRGSLRRELASAPPAIDGSTTPIDLRAATLPEAERPRPGPIRQSRTAFTGCAALGGAGVLLMLGAGLLMWAAFGGERGEPTQIASSKPTVKAGPEPAGMVPSRGDIQTSTLEPPTLPPPSSPSPPPPAINPHDPAPADVSTPPTSSTPPTTTAPIERVVPAPTVPEPAAPGVSWSVTLQAFPRGDVRVSVDGGPELTLDRTRDLRLEEGVHELRWRWQDAQGHDETRMRTEVITADRRLCESFGDAGGCP